MRLYNSYNLILSNSNSEVGANILRGVPRPVLVTLIGDTAGVIFENTALQEGEAGRRLSERCMREKKASDTDIFEPLKLSNIGR